MDTANQKKMDAVLKRMLATPHKPHETLPESTRRREKQKKRSDKSTS